MNYDVLSFKFEIEVKKELRNISKQDRILLPIVYSDLKLYINDLVLDDEEVFVENIFFDTLVNQGRFPLFTCTCGVFGCGGYYVDVLHNKDGVVWITEQSPFKDKTVEDKNEFMFSWENIMKFAEELTKGFEDVNNRLLENGQQLRYPTKRYREIIENRTAKL